MLACILHADKQHDQNAGASCLNKYPFVYKMTAYDRVRATINENNANTLYIYLSK